MTPKEATVLVGNDGIRFGNAWFSHEKLMGVTAAEMNHGPCPFPVQCYVEWLDSVLGSAVNKAPLLNPEPNFWYPPRDEQEARNEGWCVFAVDREHCTHEIQKVDAAPQFATDGAALAYIMRRAMEGSVLHSRAIQFCLNNSKHRSE